MSALAPASRVRCYQVSVQVESVSSMATHTWTRWGTRAEASAFAADIADECRADGLTVTRVSVVVGR